MMHPNTYVNKILFASNRGLMQLWNIAANKLVYEFKKFEGEFPRESVRRHHTVSWMKTTGSCN